MNLWSWGSSCVKISNQVNILFFTFHVYILRRQMSAIQFQRGKCLLAIFLFLENWTKFGGNSAKFTKNPRYFQDVGVNVVKTCSLFLEKSAGIRQKFTPFSRCLCKCCENMNAFFWKFGKKKRQNRCSFQDVIFKTCPWTNYERWTNKKGQHDAKKTMSKSCHSSYNSKENWTAAFCCKNCSKKAQKFAFFLSRDEGYSRMW